jgi:hypothetical protein
MSKGINHICTIDGDGEYLTTYTRTRQGKRNVTVNRRVGPRAARRWCKTHGATFPTAPTLDLKVGQWVCWKAAGKVSRLDSVAGTIVRGRVIEIDTDRGQVIVMKGYQSIVPRASLDLDQVI